MNERNNVNILIAVIGLLIIVIVVLVAYIADIDTNAKISEKIAEEKSIARVEKTVENIDKEVKNVASRVGSFLKTIDELEFVEDKNGTYAGWESQLHSDACGWWCTVEDAVQDVVASSTLQSGKHINYLADNVNDVKRDTAWVEGVDGDGIGEYIKLTKQFICREGDTDGGRLGEICIVNGYANTEKLWKENNRVKKLLLYVDDVPYAYLDLEDTIQPQYFNVWENGYYELKPSQKISLKFEILEVYEGTKYDDTAITYLDVNFLKGH